MSPRLLLPAVAVFAGCAVAMPPRATDPPAPSAWVAEPPAAGGLQAAPDTRWWTGFGDPDLDRLMASFDARNLDLARAQARIAEARAERAAAAARLRPDVGFGTTAARGNAGRIGSEVRVSHVESALDAAWEIDFSGATAARVEAAEHLLQSGEAAARDLERILRAEVAQNYVELRAAQERLRLMEEILRSRRDTAALLRALRDAGLRSELEVAGVDSAVQALDSRLPGLRTEAVAPLRRLETLLGHQPGVLDAALGVAALPRADAGVVLATPAAVIARRPDLRRAAGDREAARALAAAAAADFYPKFTLGSLAGLREVAAGPAGPIWALAAMMSAPLYTAGRLEARSGVAEARRDQAELAYRQAVLSALGEVEVAVTAYVNAGRTLAALDALVDTEQRRLALSEERYHRGIAGFADVLDAQRALYLAQTERVNALAASARSYILVFAALGG